ncbi:MAG: hypothetical protein H0X50_02175 [Nitrosopumilus sp.]|nr:hypothetical protein [Nitrosopumilus sp.]
MIKPTSFVYLFFLTVYLNFFSQLGFIAFSQSETNSFANDNNTWISKQNNLNITMSLNPEIPLIDQKAKILFEVKKLNESGFFENLNAKVTITDHDGRIFRFASQPVDDGKFFVEYMFPDHGEHIAILQLYKNGSAFSISSFNLVIPHFPPPPSPFDNFLSNLFKYIY